MARYLLLSLAFMLISTMAIGQTSIEGKVTEADTGEPVLFGNVALFKGGVLITGVETDFDGNYNISNIDPGTYDVEFSYLGLQTQRISGVVASAGKSNKLDAQLTAGGINLDEIVVVDYKVPLIEQDNTTQGAIVTSEQIRTLPTKNINGLAASTAGIGSADDGADLNVRGSRADATDYYIDGIRVRGNSIPATEIDQMQVITGGIGAEYGDVAGGIISITTKGPSSKYSGSLELETSQFLDAFGYNLGTANVSGPILKREDGTSILGFRVSAQYINQLDGSPPALARFKVKDEFLRELEANPVTTGAGGNAAAGELLTNEHVEQLDYNPNNEYTRLDFTGKIDARLSDQIDISLSGTYNKDDDYFSPDYTGQTIGRGTWTTFNSDRNPLDVNTVYRGNFRFRHRLGGNTASDGSGNEQQSTSVIQNASYTLQFGYERTQREFGDIIHGDNLFNYGHVGTFDYRWDPIVANSEWSGALEVPGGGRLAHADYRQNFLGYTPGTANPILANYNNGVVDTDDPNDFIAINGDFNGSASSVWAWHTNVGQVYNTYNKNDSDYLTFNAKSSFDFLPGGSESGRHSIQFGLLYEQRFLRGYRMNPRELWVLARGNANRHLSGVDTLSATSRVFTDDTGNPFTAGVEFTEFAPFNTADQFEGNYFFRRVRELVGAPIGEYFNVDALDPNDLSLDLFSSRELNDYSDINLAYYGYDYLGNKLGNDVTFDDFFTAEDENGVRTLPVAAFQPIYGSAYIQDKFTFKDIIFRLGVRVDYYDANTKVLKDPYSLYEPMNARDFYALDDVVSDRPGTIGDDFNVYVSSDEGVEVKAFRDGDQWYFPDGSEANDGNLIYGANGVVYPKYYEDRVNSIRDRDFDVSNSFEDYKPQINIMPRLAFSFPISDEANFFAHYDILVQRPSSLQARGTALDYFYMEERSGNVAVYRNPALKPQRTVDYEVGFQQKVSNSSALKIAAYYKELRDMIQRRPYQNVATPIGSYTAYDNQDFGTVKGFSFTYDMRRTNNLQLVANYTLQFADGTGSDANSQQGLLGRGNIRNLFPLNYDERHNLNLTLDYRYSDGPKYDGPVLFGKDIFANAGINIQSAATSGRPYTARVQPTQFGGTGTKGALNGARQAWKYTVNLRIDKSFTLTKEGAKHPMYLNVYLRVQNLFDTRNILDVYSASGSAEDDGFLTSANGQDAIDQVIDTQNRSLEAYLDAYQWRLIDPDFYSLPRRIYLGAAFEF